MIIGVSPGSKEKHKREFHPHEVAVKLDATGRIKSPQHPPTPKPIPPTPPVKNVIDAPPTPRELLDQTLGVLQREMGDCEMRIEAGRAALARADEIRPQIEATEKLRAMFEEPKPAAKK